MGQFVPNKSKVCIIKRLIINFAKKIQIMYKTKDRIEQEFERYKVLRDKYWEQPFGVLRSRVQEIESEIRSVVGTEPGWIDMTALDRHKDETDLLLGERKVLLDWMFCETPEEVERMRVVNQRLFDLTNRLRVKMADVAEYLASRERDDFDDDFDDEWDDDEEDEEEAAEEAAEEPAEEAAEEETTEEEE